jgi:receptor protein-tyrosine kinase/non-specific protein-tyrosine kinase
MSRFAKALERVRSTQSGRAAGPDGVMVPEGTPAPETFETPWQVKGTKETSETSETSAPRITERKETSVTSAPRLTETSAPRIDVTTDPAPTAVLPVSVPVHAMFAEKVVTDAEASAGVVEQYLNLAGHLQWWQAKSGGKCVIVSSATAGDGRTLTALNLALALRSSFQRHVLLVDCDLHHPALHEALLVERRPGVTDAVAAGARPSAVMVSAKLSVLPAGRPSSNATAILKSDAMAALLQQMRAEYDWIIIDTPPAAEHPDAGLLGPLADGVLLVVAAGRTTAATVRRVVAGIGRKRIVGMVLNGVAAGDMTAAGQLPFQSR